MKLPAFLAPPTVDVAVELAHARVTVAEYGHGAVSAFATELLPAEAIVPALTGVNIPKPEVVVAALKRAFERAGLRVPRRVALVVPDSIARVSLLTFEQLPPRAADLDQLVRWQLRKAAPFPIEDAQVSFAVVGRDGSAATVAAVLARRDVIAQYESITSALGMHAGLVDLASLNVAHTVLASGTAPTGDWLLVHLTAESTTLAIFRGASMVSYRNRTGSDVEPLSTLVHQTAMYHEDRLGGSRFERVLMNGTGNDVAAADRVRREIGDRLGVAADPVDAQLVARMRDRVTATPDVLDALAAPVGILIRDRKAA